MGINGAQLASNCLDGRAARGFFDLFYRWNNVGCVASPRRHTTKALYQKCAFTKLLFPSTTQHGRRAHSASSTHASPNKSTQQQLKPTTKPEPPLSTSLRSLMRTLPHSVVVLTTTTTRAPSASTTQDYKGMTLSSFTTLTLTPQPIVTFNIRQPSQTLSALKSTKFFLIHMLEGTREGARVADAFTRGNSRGNWNGKGIPFAGLEVRELGLDADQMVVLPRIREKGVGRVLVCEVHEGVGGFVEVGDHVVVIAGVREILDGEGVQQSLGLCYVNGAYRAVGEVLEVERDRVSEE